ncbi:hypothetical protein ACTFIR_012040 [Dictyostelium discoideum]
MSTISKKWYNFISLSISNNIINNKSFEHWLKIDNNNNNKSFFENYNNQNQYDKNNLIFKNKDKNLKQNKISFNKEFSIIKIKESIINDYFKFNLFLNNITIDDFKEIKNKFENNQLLYKRIVVNVGNINDGLFTEDRTLFKIHHYLSNESSEIITNLFKILELNYDIWLENGYIPHSIEDGHQDTDDEGGKKCTEIYFNNLSVDSCEDGQEEGEEELDKDETVKIFKIFKGNNLFFNASHTIDGSSLLTFDYSALFDPDNSGQQVESIKVIKYELEEAFFVEPLPINSYQILSNLSHEMGFGRFHHNVESANSENMKSELNQMINSFITSKSLKNLNISLGYLAETHENPSDYEILANNLNETVESYSNSFKPLFSELNTSIERIELDIRGLLNIDTISNLLNNKSIKYLYLYDFIVYSPKQIKNGKSHKEPISINQYLFDNIFSSPLTSIRHYKIKFIELKEIKFIFNLILNNIFKLQFYSLIFEFNQFYLIVEFIKEYKNLINNISKQQQQQQQQQQKLNNINLKEIKIKN